MKSYRLRSVQNTKDPSFRFVIELKNSNSYEIVRIDMTRQQWEQFINDAISIAIEPGNDIEVRFNE